MNAFKAARVSIIMPCYNAAAHLPRSVGSVLAQTYADWELVIVDDGSKDQSWQSLQHLASQDKRIRVYQQANAGAASARNHALRKARDTYTAFLDSDDTWHPEFLEAMVAALDADSAAGIAYCGWQNIGLGKGRDEPFIPPDYENGDKIEALLGGCRWPIHRGTGSQPAYPERGLFRRDAELMHGLRSMAPVGNSSSTRSCTACACILLSPRRRTDHAQPGTNGHQPLARAAEISKGQSLCARHPGGKRIRQLTSGELLHRGYDCYWKRDLPAARRTFRAVMNQGYGTCADWKYMLPAWLPESWHCWLIGLRDRGVQTTDRQS